MITQQEFVANFIKETPNAIVVHTPRIVANGGKSPFVTFPQHCWVVYDGKCYDADCPNGTESWHELPTFRNCKPAADSDCDAITIDKFGIIVDYRLKAA